MVSRCWATHCTRFSTWWCFPDSKPARERGIDLNQLWTEAKTHSILSRLLFLVHVMVLSRQAPFVWAHFMPVLNKRWQFSLYKSWNGLFTLCPSPGKYIQLLTLLLDFGFYCLLLVLVLMIHYLTEIMYHARVTLHFLLHLNLLSVFPNVFSVKRGLPSLVQISEIVNVLMRVCWLDPRICRI